MSYRRKKRHTPSDGECEEPESRREPVADVGNRNPPGVETQDGVSGRRLWLFRGLAAVIVPMAVLFTVELVLALGGYGYPNGAVVRCEIDGKPHYCDNVRFGWRFFPRNIARSFGAFSFPAEKSENSYRIFVLGASAAKGEPEESFSVGRLLDVMLRDLYPGVDFEVISVAAAAINSHVVLPIAKDLSSHEPDLFVVYLGHNEVTGPYGAGTVFAPLSRHLALVRLGIGVRETRLGQLMTSTIQSLGAGSDSPAVWRGMGMFLEKQVRRDAAALNSVYGHFKQNLLDIVGAGDRAGARVLLSTVPSNLKDTPPFASLHRIDIRSSERKQFEAVYREGGVLESNGRFREALTRYDTAARIDETRADLHFRMGRCLWSLGDYRAARKHYVQARELDTLRFRADDRTNSVIREVAHAGGDRVLLADAVRAFENHSPHGLPGEALFYEHVHLNFEGTHLLAATLLQAVEKALPEKIRKQRVPGRRAPDVRECERRLAYTGWDRYRIAAKVLNGFIRKPPFTNQLYHNEQVQRLEQSLRDLTSNLKPENLSQAAAQYREAISRRPHDWVLHFKHGTLLAESLHDLPAAAAEFHEVINRIPHSWIGYNALGTVLLAEGKLKQAIAQFERSLNMKPHAWESLYLMAKACRADGDLDRASTLFSALLEVRPDSVSAYENLARILLDTGDSDKAEAVLRRGVSVVPESTVLNANLGTLLVRQKEWDEAIAAYEKALSLAPDSEPIRKALEKAKKRGASR